MNRGAENAHFQTPYFPCSYKLSSAWDGFVSRRREETCLETRDRKGRGGGM